jgi:hypothetical protein
MRLWSLHPSILDPKGFGGLWRECCVAVNALKNKRGYYNHPQLDRFKNQQYPLTWLNCYMYYVYLDSIRRGYNYNRNLISDFPYFSLYQQQNHIMTVTSGQVKFEFKHLIKKLQIRCPEMIKKIIPTIHPMFVIVPGPVENWERGNHGTTETH